jgi:hypothetical protein
MVKVVMRKCMCIAVTSLQVQLDSNHGHQKALRKSIRPAGFIKIVLAEQG